VTPEHVARAVAEQYELPFVELEVADIDMDAASLFDEELARRYAALPIESLGDGALLVAVADPATVLFAEDLRAVVGKPLRFAITAPPAMEAALEVVFASDHGPSERAQPSDGDVSEPPEVDARPAVVPQPAVTPRPLGALLVRDGVITELELHAALAQQRLTAEKRLGEILVEREAVTAADVARVVAEQYELPFVDLAWPELDLETARLLSPELRERLRAVPLDFESDGALRVAIADPATAMYSEELRSAVGVPLTFVVAPSDAIDEALAFVLREVTAEAEEPSADEPLPVSEAPRPDDHATEPVDDELEEARELLLRALSEGATSLHLSPRPGGLVIRARIGEELRELEIAPRARQAELIESLEALRSVELDGRTVELQAHVVPTRHGKRVTVRVRPELRAVPALADLGLPVDVEEAVRRALARASGAVLVCGAPDGARTGILHGLVAEIDADDRIVLTVDDGPEYLAHGVDQIDIAALDDPTFASGLRAALGLDPDVVLVAQLEDRETARLALEAAAGGRLVLAGLRASSTAVAYDLLMRLGLDRELVATAVSCVVAQRALRRVCMSCREPYYATAEELVLLGLDPDESGRRLLARGKGCVECGETGFSGHAVAYEASERDARGSRLLSGDVIRLCLEGITTADEVRRAFES
jgi:type IV pilus assembly protein PilB